MRVDATAEWAALAAHADELRATTLRELFAADPARGTALTATGADLVLDFSKNRATGRTVELLVALAERVGLRERTAAMLRGDAINVSERRAVLHTALRLPRDASLVVDGVDVVAEVHQVLDRMGDFAEAVRSGAWRGATGERIEAVVNIGIGGSDLGPAMAYRALVAYADPAMAFRFVSNVDPADLTEALRGLDPATTLVVVCSKTFGTLETLTNARAARTWLVDGLGGDPGVVARHFVAVSTNAERVAEFGIDPANMFGFWDWVGGRYSMDSAIGLSTMVAIGREAFAQMLAGFHAVDTHFATAPYERNVPALLGLLAVWYSAFFDAQSYAVLPYSHYLSRFPAYLQQLCMESNGKAVTADGDPVSWDTGEIVWGEPGTNGQHAFYQLLHQGTRLVPCDFIGFAAPIADRDGMHDLLLSNLLAQPRALAFGRTAAEVAAAGAPADQVAPRVMPGNRPSNVLLAPRLTPRVLGELVATYEHRVFTQGTVWGIDSFDQWGVELGKVMASELTPVVSGEAEPGPELDSSTVALLERIASLRQA